ncbi:hypothetical protein [Paraliobacillus ryukyuensis]|uniref:hypothetical protein n=1 Tax=Paraliobacillus ryukyuensis TaxID=200904 RepID=UPI0011807C94|nr:hypothetical protein [Paraliobacillus ryukyuensis]
MMVRVTTHSGEDDTVEVLNYDAQKITKMRNDTDIESIQIGDGSYSRIDIKTVKPIEELDVSTSDAEA